MRAALLVLALGSACLPFPDDPSVGCAADRDCETGTHCSARGICVAFAEDASVDAGPDAGVRPDARPARDATPAPCEDFAAPFEGPLDGAEWQLNGAATLARAGAGDGVVELTRAGERESAGSVLRQRRVRAERFTLQLGFSVPAADEPIGDGLALGWFDEPPFALGPTGSSFGALGLEGYGVAIDTFANGSAEPASPFLVVFASRGPLDYDVLGQSDGLATLRDGEPHTLTVELELGVVRVAVDGARVLTTTIAGYTPFDATFGVTGANGFETGRQRVHGLSLECAAPSRFAPGFAHRRAVSLPTLSATIAAGLTIRVPVPHAELVASGRSRADGRDLALYARGARIDVQLEDRGALGTDALALIARLPSAHPEPLQLYYGAPEAFEPRNDRVFVLAERFDGGAFTRSGWTSAWGGAFCADRAGPELGSVCVTDAPSDTPLYRVLSLPSLPSPLGRVYELSASLGGGMAEPTDLLVLAESNALRAVPPGAFLEGAPGDVVSYTDDLGQTRTATGWHRPLGAPWSRTRVRLPPRSGRGRVFLGFLSLPPTDLGATEVSIDDLTVRATLEPDPTPTLGPEQSR